MEFLKGFNVTCSSVLLLNRELTAKEINLYSKYDIKIPSKGEVYPVPYSKVRNTANGMHYAEVKYGFPYGGYLASQKNITANTLYKAQIHDANNKIDLVLATETKAWREGVSIPDASFKIFDNKTLFPVP